MKKIYNNISWLFLDRVLETGVALIVGVWLARYLGPEDLGSIHFAVAFIWILIPFGQLGQANIVIREIVNHRDTPEVLLGTSFVLVIIASFLVFCGLNLYANVYTFGEKQVGFFVSLLSITILFRTLDVVKWWYQSQVLSKHVVIAVRSGMFVAAGIKIWMILSAAPVSDFVWTWVIQSAITAILLWSGYVRRYTSLRQWRFDSKVARRLLLAGWPLLISSVASLVYLHIDRIMLGHMVGSYEVGIYSVAARLSELFYVFPFIIVGTLYPAIIKSKSLSESLYLNRIQSLIDLMAAYSYIGILILVSFAHPIINIMYGEQFENSATVLQIHAAGLLFVATGIVRNRWLIADNKTKFIMMATTLGAVVNVVLNLLLIPAFQSIGAAWATVVSYCFSTYISCLLTRDTISVFKVLSKGFVVPVRLADLIRFVGDILKNKKRVAVDPT